MNETTARSVLECCNLNPSVTEGLTFSHHASYIYRTAVPLLPRLHFIFIQQIYLIIFLDFLSPSPFIPPQNVVYFLTPSPFIPPQNVVYLLMLHFLIHKIFTFYTNGVLNCECPAPGPEGLNMHGIRMKKKMLLVTQILHQPLHICKIYKILHMKTLKTLLHVSVLRPSSGSYYLPC